MDSRPIHNRNTRIDPESGQRASNSEHLEQTRSHNPQQPPFPSINSPQTQNDHLPHTVMFRRFSLFSSMYGIIWFLTAYILVCTSLKTCRLSSPHIWWLTIAILCTMYLKFILLSLIVSVFALVFKTQIIRQDIRKLPKNLVDRIPLVVVYSYPPKFPTRRLPGARQT
ncbi:MAG: hypothetical protein NXY57DRAFT_477177 [Lentinula lateritia]|nr:MAG: hypothetical protein NXY57DRAFT_477177 [Lentinula lateritia]